MALKVLPQAFTDDPDRLARFEREAKVLASLNHPNIGSIYGLEEAEGQKALVLELVEGPTLAERIKQGPIPVDEALPIAKQIAEALEAAHEQGIIHRDLKPANVKVKDDGTVKVLDFGLAKAFQPEVSDASMSQSPTISLTAAATQMGMVIGTAAYMAPEQAKGRPVDKRADVWAFGAVLFEILTGRQAFGGTDVSETLAAVLRQEMDWNELPSDTPNSVRRLLRRCLERDHKRRLPEIGTARLEIDEADAALDASPEAVTTPVVQPALWQRPVPALVAAVALLALGLITGTLADWNQAPSDPPLVVRMPIPLAWGDTFTNSRRAVAISPDGSHIVYSANRALTLRPVDQLQGTMIAGTDGEARGGSRGPFFSPNGQWIGYEAAGQLKKVALSGGAPITLGESDRIWGASWSADDMILFGRGPDGIWQVPGGLGGTPEPLITVEDGEQADGPQMLPGGEWVLFTLRPANTDSWDEAQIVVQSLATGERRVLVAGGRDGRYVATGHLVYVLNSVLFAIPFDAGAQAVTGGPVSLVEDIRDAGVSSGAAHFSLSNTGSLVYIPGSAVGAQINLVWVDRSGEIELVGAEPRDYQWARVSPDGARLAVQVQGLDGVGDVWIYDVFRDTLTRLTFDEANDGRPLWTPDGSRVVFQSSRDGGGLFWRAADGTGDVEQLLESSDFPRPYDWSADGRLVFDQLPGAIGVLTVEGERPIELLLDTEFTERTPAISPDGRWIAYDSDESGLTEVYVRPFPGVEAGKWQVSNDGGRQPAWSPSGQELFFQSPASASFMVSQVETAPTFSWTTPERLFGLESVRTAGGREWDIVPDGDRFVFLAPGPVTQTSGEAGFNGLIFVENWFQELTARVPVQ